MKALIQRRTAIVILLGVVLATGCRHQSEPLHLICVVDLTSSTEAQARSDAFQSIRAFLQNKQLKRGDMLTVIPVTDDALTQSQGRILRFQLSERREAYDSDLQRLSTEVENKLQSMQAEAEAHPYKSSDILGAVNLAAEELAHEPNNVRKVIVVLSDLVQDDTKGRFKVAPALANETSAAGYAKKLAAAQPQRFKGASVYLGLLRSTDLKAMSQVRRSAVQVFWVQYFRESDAQAVSLITDGPGQITKAFRRAE